MASVLNKSKTSQPAPELEDEEPTRVPASRTYEPEEDPAPKEPEQPLSDKPEEHWAKSYWRPAMAWQYVAVCLFDFLIAPVFFAMLKIKYGVDFPMWKSITLAEGGLYHLAMGAVLGVAAWGRTQEKQTRTNTSSSRDDDEDRYSKYGRNGR